MPRALDDGEDGCGRVAPLRGVFDREPPIDPVEPERHGSSGHCPKRLFAAAIRLGAAWLLWGYGVSMAVAFVMAVRAQPRSDLDADIRRRAARVSPEGAVVRVIGG